MVYYGPNGIGVTSHIIIMYRLKSPQYYGIMNDKQLSPHAVTYEEFPTRLHLIQL